MSDPASFGSVLATDGLFAKAAAYLFHIVSNHPFVDGNKRAGLLAAQALLHLNGIVLLHDSEALYHLRMGVAAKLERIAKWKTAQA